MHQRKKKPGREHSYKPEEGIKRMGVGTKMGTATNVEHIDVSFSIGTFDRLHVFQQPCSTSALSSHYVEWQYLHKNRNILSSQGFQMALLTYQMLFILQWIDTIPQLI